MNLNIFQATISSLISLLLSTVPCFVLVWIPRQWLPFSSFHSPLCFRGTPALKFESIQQRIYLYKQQFSSQLIPNGHQQHPMTFKATPLLVAYCVLHLHSVILTY